MNYQGTARAQPNAAKSAFLKAKGAIVIYFIIFLKFVNIIHPLPELQKKADSAKISPFA
jgi:hypothetical protein